MNTRRNKFFMIFGVLLTAVGIFMFFKPNKKPMDSIDQAKTHSSQVSEGNQEKSLRDTQVETSPSIENLYEKDTQKSFHDEPQNLKKIIKKYSLKELQLLSFAEKKSLDLDLVNRYIVKARETDGSSESLVNVAVEIAKDNLLVKMMLVDWIRSNENISKTKEPVNGPPSKDVPQKLFDSLQETSN